MNTPNGINSWLETYFELACYMGLKLGSNPDLSPKMQETQDTGGHMAHQQECRRLTDLFEKTHEGENWFEKDWYDTVDTFIQENL